MLKEALSYIVGLGKESQDIVTAVINGDIYVKGDVRRIPFDQMKKLDVNSLTAVADYVKDCLDVDEINKPYIINVNYDSVYVYSGLDDRYDRDLLVKAEPLLPRISFNQWMDMESFVIQLKSNFIETDNLNMLVKIVSSITDKAQVKIEDDGFGISISQTSGTAIMKQESLSVNPIAMLAPYRTFIEVDQPESRFLLRVRDGGMMALYEADGGMWKLEAQENVSAKLRNLLEEEINNGNVVVVG